MRRCRPYGRGSPRRRPPNRTCDFHRIRLSMSTSRGYPLAQLALSVKYPLPCQATARRCSPATSFHPACACSLDPFALWTAFPPSPVGRDSHDYYGPSATPRRQQRTVHLPRTKARRAPPRRFPRSLICRSAGSAPSCTPGHRRALPQHGPRPRPPDHQRADETVANYNRDRAPQQPIAARFRGCCPVSGLQALVRLLRLSALLPHPARWRRTVARSSGAAPALSRTSASGCPLASPDRYGGRVRGLSPRPVIWRLVAQYRVGMR
jgi:hypothetical protein